MATKDYINKRLKEAGGLGRNTDTGEVDPQRWYEGAEQTLWAPTRYWQWLDSGHSVTVEAARKIMDTLNADATGRRSDGARRVRPSLIGKCVRQQALSFHGIPQSEEREPSGYSVAVVGTWGHYRWQAAGLSAGFFDDVEVLINSGWVRGQVDAVCSDGAVFELKTVDPAIYKPFRNGTGVCDYPRLADVKQVHAYMEALGCDTARIVYENRARGDIVEWTVAFDEAVWEQVQSDIERVSTSNGLNLPRPLPDCVQQQGNDYKWCSWATVCRPEGPPWDAEYLEEVHHNA